jgi:NADH dehydrogenase
VAGEFLEFLRRSARLYRNVRPQEASVTLLEITDRILSALDPDLSEYATSRMTRAGVQVRLRTSVTRIEPKRIELSTGESLESHTVIWCAGIAPNPVIAQLALPKDPCGYLVTERDLRVSGFANLWAIGDCAVNPGPDGKPYPATAQHAVREAEHAAGDIVRLMRKLPTRPTQIPSRGSIASIGCRTGVAKIFGLKLSGFWAWWLYRSFYLMKMPGLARKIRVALDWTMDLLLPQPSVQLDIGGGAVLRASSRQGGRRASG